MPRSAAPIAARSRLHDHAMGIRRTMDAPESGSDAHAAHPAAADRVVSDAAPPGHRTRIAVPSDPGPVVPAGAVHDAAAPDIRAAVAGGVAHVDRVVRDAEDMAVGHVVVRAARRNEVDHAGHPGTDEPGTYRGVGVIPDSVLAPVVASRDLEDGA